MHGIQFDEDYRMEDTPEKRRLNYIINISKNYYMRPERPVHQTLRTVRTLTVTLDATSAGRHVRTPFPLYPCVLNVPTTSTTKPMRPDALRP